MEYQDFDFGEFVEKLYKEPPQDPHTFVLEFLTEIPKNKIQEYLGHILVYGAKTLYNVELAGLTHEQIEIIRKYLNSIGWNADFKVETHEINGQKYNHWQIEFFPLKLNNTQNVPEKIIP